MRGDTWAESLLLQGGGTSANWAIVEPYGAGANPKIAPGTGVSDFGIKLHNNNASGWKILNIDVSNCRCVGIDAEHDSATLADGAWIEGCKVTGISGMTVATSGSGPFDAQTSFDVFCGTGIMVSLFKNITLKNCTVQNCDMPALVISYDTLLVDNMQSDHCNYEGFTSSVRLSTNTYRVGPSGVSISSSNGVIQNSNFQYMGYNPGMYFGTAGVQVNGGTNITVQDTEVGFTGVGGTSPDQLGIDVEGYASVNVQLVRCNVHDCGGAGLLMFNSSGGGFAGTNAGTQVRDSTFANNGGVLSTVTFMRMSGNATNNMTVTGNTFTRRVAGACGVGTCLNNILDGVTTPQGLQDTFPTRFTVSGNTTTN